MPTPEQYPEGWPYGPKHINELNAFYALKHALIDERDGVRPLTQQRWEEIRDWNGITQEELTRIGDLASRVVHGLAPSHEPMKWDLNDN